MILKQDRTTAEDHEENERREKEIHDVKAAAGATLGLNGNPPDGFLNE